MVITDWCDRRPSRACGTIYKFNTGAQRCRCPYSPVLFKFCIKTDSYNVSNKYWNDTKIMTLDQFVAIL